MAGATASIDEARLERFMGAVVAEVGAAFNAALVRLGDRLGLYRAMAGAGPLSAVELARRTGTTERYVREWLAAQAAGGFVDYDAESGCFELPPEHALVLAQEDSPVFALGHFEAAAAMAADESKLADAFRTGDGVGWHEHDERLFEATERAFRPLYRGHLTSEWLPALDGVEEKLLAGAKVADVGCGRGASAILIAEAYPASTVAGFDYHADSIEAARNAAAAAGVAERVAFEAAGASDYPGSGYDLVCFFDALHDMGDPVGACRHVLETLSPDGVLMLVEPRAGDRVEENLNPVGRLFYCASTMFCTPASLDQEVGLALGAQAGEARLADVVRAAGFTRFRRAAETPFNLVLEARP